MLNGLPRGHISAIAQTADGYLWIGTEQGARRFDGVTFTSPRDSGPESPALDRVLGLAADHSGGLWMRMPGPTLVRYQNDAFAPMRMRPKVDALVTAMTSGQDESLLFATRLDGVVKWNGTQFETIAPKSALPSSPIISIVRSANGAVWLGTVDTGILRVEGDAITAFTKGIPDIRINCLLASGKDELYAGTNRGLVRWDGARFTQAGIPAGLRGTRVLSLARDRDANVWIGTAHGLLRWNAQGLSSLPANGSGQAVTALFEDREGDLWLARGDELERIRETAFVNWRSGRHGGSQHGGPIHADSRGRIWAALSDGGVHELRDGSNREIAIPGLGVDEVYSIAGSGDDLWLGRQSRGLTHVQFHGGARSSRTYSQADGLPQASVYAVHQSRDGSIWAGTLTGGVSHFQDDHFTNYTTATGLISNAILSMEETADGSMWFATPSGLSRFAQNRWTAYGTEQGLPAENVNTLFEDSAKILWVGTPRGLAFVRSGKIFTPRGLPLSLSGQIFGIAEDHLGSLWITTSRGVARADRAGLMAGNLSGEEVRELGASDGVVEPSGLRRERSITADPSGRIWLSTPNGIGYIDPARLRRTAMPTIVHLDHVILDGESHDLSGSVPVPPGTRRIVIEYAGVNLTAPESVKFRFRLDGFDSQWGAPVSRREAVYTNLNPGSYQFHIIAGNADQVWGKAETTFSFRLPPTLPQNWWVRSAAIVVFGLSAILFYRLRLRQVTEQVNDRFEARLAERNRIARELHDTLLQSFHGLMLRFQAVENLLPDKPSQAKESLVTAIERAARAITEGRDAVQELRSNEYSRNDLCETLTSLGQELARSENGRIAPSFRVLIEGVPRELHPGAKEDLYRISREAMINAFRHSQANSIELDIRFAPRLLRLRLRDDGIGMDPKILASGGRDGHWGIPGMQERARAIQGHLEIWSETARGTEIELQVPASIAYSEFRRPPVKR